MINKVVAIFVASGAEESAQPVNTALLEAGRGIVGDRYYTGKGSFSEKLHAKMNFDWEVTLIESEEIDRFNEGSGRDFGYGDFRRNIATKGVKLNFLVEKKFSIGNVPLEGIRLCEPCAHLARLTDERVLPALVGRAGLRARILSSGSISVGDFIEVLDL